MFNYLKLAYFYSSGWEIEVVDTLWTMGQSFELDSINNPCISYIASWHDVKYGYMENNDWYFSVIDTGYFWDPEDQRADCSITLDNESNPHVVYFYRPDSSLRYARGYLRVFESRESNILFIKMVIPTFL